MVVIVVAFVLGAAALGERRSVPIVRPCTRAIMVDSRLWCDEEVPAEVAALCPAPGPEAHEPIAAGDAFDTSRLCARSFASPDAPGRGQSDGQSDGQSHGQSHGWSRMSPDDLAALQQPVDLNRASIAELTSLPRIGPALARRIVQGRPYDDVESLVRVRGIGPATVARLRGRAFVRPSVAVP